MKCFLVSFSRSSEGAISKLRAEMEKKGMLTSNLEEAQYLLAVGDRRETFDFVLNEWRRGRKVIHLWAGEISQGTYDEVYRHAITMMSDLQLCTSPESKKVVARLMRAVGMKPNAKVVGNVMLDNMEIDESVLKENNLTPGEYDLILYNPCRKTGKKDVEEIFSALMISQKPYIWIRPNMDRGMEDIMQFVNSGNQPRPKFLALLKNCHKFITNSSCEFYEAPFLIGKEQVIHIGERNRERNSKDSNMKISNATKKIIKEIQKLGQAKVKKPQAQQVPVDVPAPQEPQAGQG